MTDDDLDSSADDPNLSADDPDSSADDTKESTFLVTHADEESAVLRDVADGQVHTLESNPGLSEGEAVEGIVSPDPPLGVTWQLVGVEARRSLTIEESDEPPTARERELAAAQPVGELTREQRAGTGELHVITVEESETEAAIADVLDDRETTLSRAARLGVSRVEIRSEPGVISIRYLP
ncbi:hypothetical protein AArcSl_1227 [Halalkaliarchaeum desulfuricum]|uniref:Uncharacterized protein n=1 Tax=Halalkaliarchaeum desulfuricum TaxID=2055893 RepID=A0A343TID8_9EURY|nr:DUF5812 family protein [Halalkaliarchaeum desulfuricum]AUX08860.1 hypothetical protein AArcSl_1227 [Halalkaliarchaeum desulfuricum]